MLLKKDFANSATLKTIRRINFWYVLKQRVVFNVKIFVIFLAVIAVGTFLGVISSQ